MTPDKTVALMARLMTEMDPMSGSGGSPGHMGGDNVAQHALTLMTINNTPAGQSRYDDQDEEGFTDDELKLAKRFIELVGSPERAVELLDRVGDCEECLGMIDDEEQDAANIDQISQGIPSDAGSPMSNFAAQFDPGWSGPLTR
jgi:hypothetical protein